MKKLKLLGKQIAILLVFSFLVSIAAIIHGVFFDLQFEQIARLTIGGLIFTAIVIFPALLLLEWIFDINNEKKFTEIDRKLNKLQRIVKKNGK